MGHIEGTSRTQMTLLPESLDEYIAQENPVRFIDAFVDQLPLAELGFAHVEAAATGRPPYHPATLLKLYVYGYLNRIRTSRLLERETQRNVELMWLLGRLTPDFKTIAQFRRINGASIVRVCREFTLLCRELNLFGGELVAIDGSKWKAVNSRSRNFTQAKLDRMLREVEEKIRGYLKSLDQADRDDQSGDGSGGGGLQHKLRALRERKAYYESLAQRLEGEPHKQVSLTDPDARAMAMQQTRTHVVGYNVQTAVDAKHKLICAHQVTNAVTDVDQFAGMAIQAKEALAVDSLSAVADTGYYHGHQVREAQQAAITAYIAKVNTSVNSKLGLYTKSDFHYNQQSDAYRCPAGQWLTFKFSTVELGREIKYYATGACKDCPQRANCTRRKREGRRITRWVDEDLLEQMQQRVAANPAIMALRKCLSEHPFGTLKRAMDQGYFLTRGIGNVSTEMSLSVLAFNLKRVINILGVQSMIKALE